MSKFIMKHGDFDIMACAKGFFWKRSEKSHGYFETLEKCVSHLDKKDWLSYE